MNRCVRSGAALALSLACHGMFFSALSTLVLKPEEPRRHITVELVSQTAPRTWARSAEKPVEAGTKSPETREIRPRKEPLHHKQEAEGRPEDGSGAESVKSPPGLDAPPDPVQADSIAPPVERVESAEKFPAPAQEKSAPGATPVINAGGGNAQPGSGEGLKASDLPLEGKSQAGGISSPDQSSEPLKTPFDAAPVPVESQKPDLESLRTDYRNAVRALVVHAAKSLSQRGRRRASESSMTLSLMLSSSGALLEALVLSSDAPQNLEEAMLKLLRSDISFPPIPKELGMTDSRIIITLVFRMK